MNKAFTSKEVVVWLLLVMKGRIISLAEFVGNPDYIRSMPPHTHWKLDIEHWALDINPAVIEGNIYGDSATCLEDFISFRV